MAGHKPWPPKMKSEVGERERAEIRAANERWNAQWGEHVRVMGEAMDPWVDPADADVDFLAREAVRGLIEQGLLGSS